MLSLKAFDQLSKSASSFGEAIKKNYSTLGVEGGSMMVELRLSSILRDIDSTKNYHRMNAFLIAAGSCLALLVAWICYKNGNLFIAALIPFGLLLACFQSAKLLQGDIKRFEKTCLSLRDELYETQSDVIAKELTKNSSQESTVS